MLLPLGGLLLAMGMHALWNGSSTFGEYGFFAVYAAFMVPAFGLLTWLVVWTRQRELRTVREELPAYAAAGWLTPAEPFALGSMRARRLARDHAGRHLGKAGGARRWPSTRRTRRRWRSCGTGAGGAARTPTSSYGSGSCCTSCGAARRWPAPRWTTRPG